MFSLNPNHLSLALRSPRVLIAAGVGVAAAAGIASYYLRRPKPSEEELERARREALARTGRITDGTILETMRRSMADALHDSPPPGASAGGEDGAPDSIGGEIQMAATVLPPQIILYNYRIAGVSYECAQDVSMLADRVNGIRTDLPIQVRYAPHNPGNSIVVAESWSGLRLISANPFRGGSRHQS